MLPHEITNKRILLSPLNWGFGHVSRCIPLVNTFLENGNEVFIAGTRVQNVVFSQYFPQVQFIDHEGYPFEFGKQGNFGLDLARQYKPLKARLQRERAETEQMVKDLEIDIVVSDHRYGFLSSHAFSIILTHQLNLPVRWYEKWVQKLHHRFLRQFDEIWVPDTPTSEMAGILSTDSAGLSPVYIGGLSRFSLYNKGNYPKNLSEVVVISGPEVYARQFLKEEIIKRKDTGSQAVFIVPEGLIKDQPTTSVRLVASDDWKACDELILSAGKLVSRCGYSTLMDLVELKIPFALTPTPGQREQEYLYQLWYQKALRKATLAVHDQEKA